jgi:hypothetical protein
MVMGIFCAEIHQGRLTQFSHQKEFFLEISQEITLVDLT